MNVIADYLGVLKNVNFTKLWISQICSQLTNFILSFAILIKAFRLTDSSLSVSIILVSFGLATVFFGAFAGVYADRFDRKWILTIINFAQAGTVGLYLIFENNFWALALITFLYSAFNQFYLPAEAPSIPDLVPKHQLLVANSYFSLTANGSMLVGFALAGPMVAMWGSSVVFIIAISLLTVAGFASLMLPPLKPGAGRQDFFKNVWQEFKLGLKHFWDNKVLHFPLFGLLTAQLINGMLITIAPAFIEKFLRINLERGSFLVIMPLAVGILLGALALAWENRYFSKRRLVLTGLFGMGLSIVVLSAIDYSGHVLLFYIPVALLTGIFNAHVFAPSHSLLQGNAFEDVRGRVYGAMYVLLQMAATLPTFVIGLLADKIALRYIFLGMGCLLILVGLKLTRLVSARE
jgi:DHA3 family macrolide efflux protein-like MFS transporter